MFLFESSKDKEIRLGVEKNMEICISNPKKYNEAKEALVVHIRGSDQKVIEMIVDNIKATIKNQDLQPIRKYQAMLLLKDLMLTYNKALGKYVVKKILKRLTILAQHTSGSNDDREEERGKDIFGSVKRDQEVYAVQFFNTLLTALEEWGKNWPKAPDGPNKDFQRQYNELLMNGVQFPKQRPKQATKSPIKLSREDSKTPQAINPSVSPNRQLAEKSKPRVSVQRKDNPRRSSLGNNMELKLQLSQFYQKIVSSFLFLQQILQGGSLQQLQTIKDSITLIERQIQKGNEYVITMQDFDDSENDQIKIESMFIFMDKIQKDLKVLNKKPQQFKVFQTKYIKLTKKTLQVLTNKSTGKKQKGASTDKISNGASPTTSGIKIEDKPASRLDLQKKQEPKIKNKNRYVSVTGEQVLQQFNKVSKANQFQSHSGNSVNSDRFGSFGGLPAGITERPKTVISMSPANPHQKKQKSQSNSERNKQSPEMNQKAEGNNRNSELPIQSMPQTRIRSQQMINRNKPEEQNDIPRNQINNSHNFFQQFQKKQPKSEKEVNKILKKPSKEDQFGGQNFPQNQRNSEEDFFGNIESKAQGVNDISKVSRRKINAPTYEDPENMLNNVPSKINSEGLSAFQFPNSASVSVIPPARSSKNSNENDLKKDVVDDNPFNIETFRRVSQTSEHNASNFFDQFQKKPDDDILKKSGSNRSNFFVDEKVWDKRQSGINPFETGNFGNLKDKKPQKNNGFEIESIKSKKSINKSLQNPFQQDSRSSKSKNSEGSRGSKREINSFPNAPLSNNPFASNGGVKENNPFSSRAEASSNNPFSSQPTDQNQNPFQTSTHQSHQSNKNPFNQVQQFFKPPEDKPINETLNRRKQIENTRQIRAQQIRDSLVLAVNLNQQPDEGLNFSQFQDIAANDGGEKQNPFQSNNGSEKQVNNHEQSGFSLSNFPGIGEQPVQILQNNPNSNQNIQDFFSQFEKPSIISKGSKKQVPEPNVRQSGNFFENFNMSAKNSQKNRRKTISNIQKQKTISSREQKSQKSEESQKSFNFEQLDNISLANRQQKNRPSINFDDFQNLSKGVATRKSLKQNVEIDNKSQKSLSWGDFDKDGKNSPKNSSQNNQQKSSEHQNEGETNFNQIPPKPIVDQQSIPDKQQADINSKDQESPNSSLLSVNLEIADFLPLAKKGVQWNPMLKLKNAKAASFYYNVDDKKIAMKKTELQVIQKTYNEKVNIFKAAKLKNEEVRSHLLQKMKKIDAVIHQKEEFQQILKKIQETNDIKEKDISEIHSKIKRTQDIKNKILIKQRKLFQITKFQIHKEEKKSVPQRTMASKWQMFNKNLENQRNLSYTSISRFSQR